MAHDYPHVRAQVEKKVPDFREKYPDFRESNPQPRTLIFGNSYPASITVPAERRDRI
jgi:hypothetical protein